MRHASLASCVVWLRRHLTRIEGAQRFIVCGLPRKPGGKIEPSPGHGKRGRAGGVIRGCAGEKDAFARGSAKFVAIFHRLFHAAQKT